MMVAGVRDTAKLLLMVTITMLPSTVSDPSITLPFHYASPQTNTQPPTPSIFSLPLTEQQNMEFDFYNSSKGKELQDRLVM